MFCAHAAAELPEARPESEFRAGCLQELSVPASGMRPVPGAPAEPEALRGMPGRLSPALGEPYDPSIALNFSYDRTQTPLNTLVVAGVPTVLTSTTALQARFAQAFTSGTSVSVSFNNQKQRSSQQFLRFNPAFVSSFSLTITQQLLNGAGFDVNRRFLTVAESGRKITTEAVRQQVMTTLSQAETLYWDLVSARDNVLVAEKSLQVAQQLYEDNREREEAGALSKIEVFTAASEVSARRRDLIAARTVYDLRETELKNTLTRDVAKVVASVRVEPTDPLPDPHAESVPAASGHAGPRTREPAGAPSGGSQPSQPGRGDPIHRRPPQAEPGAFRNG